MKTPTLNYLLILLLALLWSCNKDDDTNVNQTTFEGSVQWKASFGGSNDEVINSVIETTDGGLVYLGTTRSINGDITDKEQEENDFWLFKTDANGTLLWSKTFGGSNDDQGQKVIATADGGLALVGFSMSADGDASQNAGIQDQWLIKLDASGNIMWEKSFGFSGSDQAFSVIATADNGLLMVGFLDITASGGEGNDFSNTTQHGVGEFWVHKLDSQGTVIWRRYFGGSNNDRAYDVVETPDHGFIIAGAAESNDFDISNPKGSYDFWVIKIDSSGTLVWEKSFGGSEIDIAYAITQTTNGNYIIVGDVRSTDGDVSASLGNADLWVIEINEQGDLLWEKTYGGSGFDTARGVYPAQDGGVFVAGSTRSNDIDVTQSFGQNDFWVIKLSSNGTLLWERTFGGSELDFAYDIIQTSNANVVVVGNSSSSDQQIENKGATDAWIVKLQ